LNAGNNQVDLHTLTVPTNANESINIKSIFKTGRKEKLMEEGAYKLAIFLSM